METGPVAGVRNLTQIEAAERARLLDVTGYDITLDLTDGTGGPGEGAFRSITTVTFECAEPGATTFIEAAAASLRSVRLNGVDVDTSAWSATTGLVLPGLATHNTLVFEADFAYSSSGQGLHRSVDPVDKEVYLYSQFETADAQRVFACFDQPDLKSVYTWHATVPAHWKVISNMPVERVDPGDIAGTKTVHFVQSPRMSTYVTALCAGPYHEVRDHHDGIDLGLFVRDSMKQYLDPEDMFDITKQGFDFFNRQFGVRYPLPKYDQIWVPEFNAGAMENFGCVVGGEEYYIFRSQVTDYEYESRANTILHEMAHMWFGDLVTMRWWDDIWLNESFAEWASHWCNAESTRFSDAWTTFLSVRKSWGYRQDQYSSTHPVYSTMPDVAAVEVNFDGITYAKGASVIKQIVAYVGIDAFVTGLRSYFRAHAWDNATFDDLLTALEEASGTPLRDFAAQWLETAQVNTLRPLVTVGPDASFESVTIAQEAPAEYPTLRTHRIAIGLYDLHGDQLIRRDRVLVTVGGASTAVPALTGVRVPDVLLVNDDDLTYAKIRLDARSMSTVVERLSGLDSSLARALCWNAAWDMTRDAELAAREYVRLVCSALPMESDINLITIALRQVRGTLEQYVDPAWQATGWQLLADTARATVLATEPGSGYQLAWARAFISASRTSEDLDTLRGWRGGDGVPKGLVIESELRWSILQALVANGVVPPAEIEAELDRDRTATGERFAATAHALAPTAEAKAETWRRLTGPPLPNWLQRSLLAGFYHPTQLTLTEPYVSKYFEVVDDIFATRDTDPAQEFAFSGYPALHVGQSTVDLTDAWLSDDSHRAGLRRLVNEGRDSMLRAIAARARDAQA
jgi:aminopeptidase N